MTGPQLLIAAIMIVLVIAFIITIVLQNVTAKKIISTNTKLVENQNTLLEQNKVLTEKLQESQQVLDESSVTERRTDVPVEMQARPQVKDKVAILREQTQQHREHIRLTADMTDEELLAWIDGQMERTHLFTDTNLTLKTVSRKAASPTGPQPARPSITVPK